MNKSMNQVESTDTSTDAKENERRRRHFRDDYKKKVVAELLSGKLDIDNVVDPDGGKISKYLIQRWKAEFRGQRFAVDAISQTRAAFQAPVITKPLQQVQESSSLDDVYQELIKLRNENTRLKAILELDLGITIKSSDSIPSAHRAFSGK